MALAVDEMWREGGGGVAVEAMDLPQAEGPGGSGPITRTQHKQLK